MPANSLLGSWGQSAPSQANGNPAGGGSLGGDTYEGQFSNSISDIPGIGNSLEGILSSIYGTKYGVPDPTQTAGAAIGGNLGNLGADTSLTLGTDTTAAEGAALPYQMNLPDYGGMLQSASGNVSQELSGQLPTDVQNQIEQAAAARGVSTGQGAGSPNTNAAMLSSLGLNSLQMQNQGMQGFGQLMGQTPTGAQFNPASMYVTPEQQQAAQLAANEEAASPDPQAVGLANTLGGVFGVSF
jgi:hypothetical protein